MNISHDDDIDYTFNYILLFRLILWGYIGIILGTFSIIANIITIIVLLSSPMRRISTNIYLIAISSSNIIFLLLFILSYSLRYLFGYKKYINNEPPFGFEIFLTRFPTTPLYNTILLSIIYLTIALSIDRLILISCPLKSKRKTLIIILLVYIFCIIYCLPYWFEQRYIPELKQCRLTNIGKKIYKYTRIYTYIPIVYVIPFITLISVSITIKLNLIQKERYQENSFEKINNNHITLMIIILIIILILSHLPLFIINVWYAIYSPFSSNSLTFHMLNTIGVLFITLNTLTIFLLYSFFSQKFQQILIKLISKIFPICSNRLNIQTENFEQNQLSLQIQ